MRSKVRSREFYLKIKLLNTELSEHKICLWLPWAKKIGSKNKRFFFYCPFGCLSLWVAIYVCLCVCVCVCPIFWMVCQPITATFSNLPKKSNDLLNRLSSALHVVRNGQLSVSLTGNVFMLLCFHWSWSISPNELNRTEFYGNISSTHLSAPQKCIETFEAECFSV